MTKGDKAVKMSSEDKSDRLRVQCASWNVNGAAVGLDSLKSWLCPVSRSAPPHIVGVALQEMVDLKDLKHYVNDEESKIQLVEWGETITATLKECYGVSFSVVKRSHLVGLGLVVVVQTHLLKSLRDVKRAKVPTGAFGMVGNKGGCSIRLKLIHADGISETSMCFVGVHLSAHQNEVQKRNQDWEAIITKTNFSESEPQPRHRRKSSNQLNIVGIGEADLGNYISDHEIIFVMGDLNYRVDIDDQIKALDQIRKRDLANLLSKDQLRNEMKMKKVCVGFTEPPITFPPTYKFEPGTSKYDTRPDKKKRIPSWCDRILYRCDSADVVCDRYRACPSLLSSDHKPIAADFRCDWISVSSKTMDAHFDVDIAEERFVPYNEFATVTQPFEGKFEDELTLAQRDQIEILYAIGDYVVAATQNKKVGFVPSANLKTIGVFESSTTSHTIEEAKKVIEIRNNRKRSSSVNAATDDDADSDGAELVVVDSGWYRALMDFHARRDEEVSFRAGEMVEVLSYDSGVEGWWIGRVRNAEQGLVPASCFKLHANKELRSPSNVIFGKSFSFEELDPNHS